jgi:hypothetical protein
MELGATMKGWGWIEKWSKSGKKYWYNSIKSAYVWDTHMETLILNRDTPRPSVCSPR